jgi:S-phase kinase-associated protein 1
VSYAAAVVVFLSTMDCLVMITFFLPFVSRLNSSLILWSQVSKEGESFTLPISVAKMSKLVETTIDDENEDEVQEIPLPNVKSSILSKVIEYCTHYQTVEPMTPITTPLKSPKIEEVVQQWYADFVKVDQAVLFELVTSANFMDIKPLLDLTCFAVAVLIKGKSADEIRTIFNISSDYAPDEEVKAAEDTKWCEN